MSVTCDIEFDNNPYGIYFAGQRLSGRFTLTSEKAKKVKGVAFKIKGFANTMWAERVATRQMGHFGGREDYIASSTYLLGSDETESVIIEPGSHTYSFQCDIPKKCPTSFEGSHGFIRYTVQVVLVRPWKFDQTFMKGFSVVKCLDLNCESPILRATSNAEVQATFCCGPCRSDPLQLQISLPQSGYVPGQDIPVSLYMTNDSNVSVKGIEIELAMMVSYFSDVEFHSRMERMVVTKIKGDPVQRNCKKLLNYSLHVPATPPTCLRDCRLVQIVYQVDVKAVIGGMHDDKMLTMPVTIGNVPLRSIIAQQPTSSSMAGGMQCSDDGGTQNMAAANETAKPPTYEEALHMPYAKINLSEAHDYGQRYFAPRYPVFQVDSPITHSLNDQEKY